MRSLDVMETHHPCFSGRRLLIAPPPTGRNMAVTSQCLTLSKPEVLLGRIPVFWLDDLGSK